MTKAFIFIVLCPKGEPEILLEVEAASILRTGYDHLEYQGRYYICEGDYRKTAWGWSRVYWEVNVARPVVRT